MRPFSETKQADQRVTHLLEKKGLGRDFRDNIFVEQGLCEHLDSLVLLGNAKLIRLFVYIVEGFEYP